MPGGATTEEAEAYLGDNRTRAPIITPGPSYRQRKDELEHERAEQLIAMGADENWGVA
jgi:hypothetical protein